MKKRKLWICPLCKKGKLGKIKPRRNDIVRYCFPCSEKSGYLVERFSPKDERKKLSRERRKLSKAMKKQSGGNLSWWEKMAESAVTTKGA